MNSLIRRGSAEARAFKAKRRTTRPARGDDNESRTGRRIADEARNDSADVAHSRNAPRRPHFAPVTFSEMGGVRFLHFGTEWVQGAMRLSRPWHIELEYAEQMMAWLLFLDAPAEVAQLGLGTAALTKFCYRKLPATRVTAVEINPAVVVAARAMFALPDDDARLHVLETDAWDAVHDGAHRGAWGALQVDLYDATARGPVYDSVAFYRACRACLTEPGMLTVNLFGDHPSFERNMRTLRQAFDGRIVALPDVHEGNRVVLAFNGPPLSFAWPDLSARATYVKETFGLRAGRWVKALRQINPGVQFTV